MLDIVGSIESKNKNEQLDMCVSKLKAFPNPVRATCVISFDQRFRNKLGVRIYDYTGKIVKTVPVKEYDVGYKQIVLNVDELKPGIYQVLILGSDINDELKLVVL